MEIADRAIRDMQRFSGDSEGFGVPITITSPALIVAAFFGFNTKHYLGLNEMQQAVSTKTASVFFSEGNLPVGYSIRNSDQEIDLKGYLVDTADSTGIVKHYKVSSWFPEEKLGGIVIILEDYAA